MDEVSIVFGDFWQELEDLFDGNAVKSLPQKKRIVGPNDPRRQPRSEEVREKISNSLTGYRHPKIWCEYCDAKGGKNWMMRFHCENCTQKYV